MSECCEALLFHGNFSAGVSNFPTILALPTSGNYRFLLERMVQPFFFFLKCLGGVLKQTLKQGLCICNLIRRCSYGDSGKGVWQEGQGRQGSHMKVPFQERSVGGQLWPD